MKVAYVDTSCLVAIAFGERGTAALARRLAGFDEVESWSNCGPLGSEIVLMISGSA